MPEIEIRRKHPNSVKSEKYLWPDRKLKDGGPGYVSVSGQTETITKIRLPDISGEYEIEELGTTVVVDMSGVSKDWTKDHHVKLESDLVGGERVIYFASQFDTSHEQLDPETELRVRVPSIPKPSHSWHSRMC